jgi:hypothetical protein
MPAKLKVVDPAPTPTSTDTAREIVARVRIPAELTAALNAWRAAGTRYARAQSALREKIQIAQAGEPSVALTREIAELSFETAELSHAVGKLMADVDAARPAYIAAVRSATAPIMASAAKKALAALNELRPFVEFLAALEREAARAGCSFGQSRGSAHFLGVIDALAATLYAAQSETSNGGKNLRYRLCHLRPRVRRRSDARRRRGSGADRLRTAGISR